MIVPARKDQAVIHRAEESMNAWANSDEPVVACEDHEAVWDEGLVVTSDVRESLMKQTRWLTRLEPSVRCWTSSTVAPMPGLTRRFGSVELESNLIGSCDTPPALLMMKNDKTRIQVSEKKVNGQPHRKMGCRILGLTDWQDW